MRATALLRVERGSGGRTVVRELRSQPPLTLVPRRGAVPSPDGTAIVHLVSSALSPLGGDRVDLRVHVGAGARLRLLGTAASIVLPGQHPGRSTSTVTIEVSDGGVVEYLPQPAVVSSRADHRADLLVELSSDARARCRETLVLGRHGEQPGSVVSTTRFSREGAPLLRQRLDIGGPQTSVERLAGVRVIATETVVWDDDPVESSSGQWWSLVPLAKGGAMANALAADAPTAERRLAEAIAHHPNAEELQSQQW